jgi:hypothetical protein
LHYNRKEIERRSEEGGRQAGRQIPFLTGGDKKEAMEEREELKCKKGGIRILYI